MGPHEETCGRVGDGVLQDLRVGEHRNPQQVVTNGAQLLDTHAGLNLSQASVFSLEK